MPSTSRARNRAQLTVGLAAAALLAMSACTSKTDTATPTTTAATGSSTTAAAGAPTTAAPGPTTTTTAPKKEIGNSDVKAALTASDPELWALVNYNIMSWEAFSGFNIPLVAGADETKGVPLCEAVSKVVYGAGNNDTSIVIAIGASDTDITGKPLVVRKNSADTCKPA